MTLLRRTKSPLGSARRTVAVATIASLFLGAAVLTLPAPHVHAAETDEAASGVSFDQTDTFIDAEALAADLANEEAAADGASTDTAAGSASDGASESSDAEATTGGEAQQDGDASSAADDGQNAGETNAELLTLKRENLTVGQGFDTPAYLSQYQIPIKTDYSITQPERPNYPLRNAFDGDWNSVFMAQKTPDDATLTVNFEKEEMLSRILFRHFTNTNGSGFPIHFKLYVSETGEANSYKQIVDYDIDQNQRPSGPVTFTLSQAVKAKSIKFEYVKTPGGVVAAEFKFLREDPLVDQLTDLFTDTKQAALKDAYNSEEKLDELQKLLDSHPLKDTYAKDMNRAWAVYRGQVFDQNDRFDWPVHVIQKTGPDSERAVWVFLASGYRSDEIEKFKEDITERVQDILNMEPFRAMAPYMNIYAYCAESNESGYSTPSVTKDTFFKSYYNSANGNVNGGSDQTRCNLARDWITKNYLDEGGKIMHATAIVNTYDYFGQGNGTSTASLSAGYKMAVHEGAHMFASLVDHYTNANVFRGDVSGTNQTANNDPETIRWKEFLGHRKVTIESAGKVGDFNVSNPTGDCLMNHYGTNIFCEICRESIFRKLNDMLPAGKKNPMYVAQPELTQVRTEQEKTDGTGTGNATVDNAKSAKKWDAGPVIDESNIQTANGRQLQYRTVVSNYLDTDQKVTLHLKITGADGTVKFNKDEEFSVHPNTQKSFNVSPETVTGNNVKITDIRMAGAKSLVLTTGTLNDLEAGDQIEAKVLYNNELMGTDANITYGTAHITYQLVDANNQPIGAMPDMGDVDQRVLTGTNTLASVPEVYGYTYSHSSIDESKWVAEEGKTQQIVRYYRQASVQLTRRLVDTNGLEIQKKSERVAIGTEITPAASDFTVARGYAVEAPATVTVGQTDLTITYTARKDAEANALGNIALGSTVNAYKTEDGKAAFVRGGDNRAMKNAVDGNHTDTNRYADFGVTSNVNESSQSSYAEFDLGGTYQLEESTEDASDTDSYIARLWRYYPDKRTYNATVVVVSEKGTFKEGDYTVLYNSDKENTYGFGAGTDELYQESADGLKIHQGTGAKASKARVYMNSSDKKGTNHIIEFQLMGRLTYNTELEQAINALSQKVESGMYTERSLTAARAVIERARKQLINGVASGEATETIKSQLEEAEKKLRAKDTSEGSIEFLGGGLRYSQSADQSLEGLRLGFRFTVPKGASIVWSKTGWDYGKTADVAAGFRSVDKHFAYKDGHIANLVVTDVPADQYDVILYARAKLTYTLDGEEKQIVSAVANSRSVDGVADNIQTSAHASTRERSLAEAIAKR